MWVYNRETLAFLDINQSAVDQYGYSRDEFLRMKINHIRLPEQESPPPRAAPRTGKGRKGVMVQRHRKKDGSIMDVEIISRPLVFGGKRAELVMATDITERKRGEEKLRTTNQALQTLIQASPLAIISLDLDGNVRSWNPAAERIFGWSELEVLGRPLPIPAEGQPQESRELLERLQKGEPLAGVESRRPRKDGSLIDVILSAAPLYNAQGDIYGVEALFADLSEHKQLEEQFRRAQKMEAVGRLAGGVAHDFNNLVTIIKGYSQLLLERLDQESSLRGFADEIQKAGDRAASLTRQLLIFSRKQVLTPQVLDLNSVVGNMEKMLRRLIGEDVVLEIGKGTNLECVKADPGQLEQVIMNLAVNARDAMPQGGKLTLATAAVELDAEYAQRHVDITAGRYVMLTVSDTGIGMDAETQARIFEPFFTTKELGRGTGLGLAIVYGIVRQSGGHISVHSQPGKGTAFKVYLPALRSGELRKNESPQERQPLPRGTETILLVEDEQGVRSLARAVLEAQGYTVLAAEDPEKAIQTSEAHPGPIALLLTDVVMPKMNGRRLAEYLAFLRPEMRILYMSSYPDEALVRQGVTEAGSPFLQKPFAPDSLVMKVREVLDAPGKGPA
jgi:two-component system cell cycle sensor histidine kinase/response regulator CckA